MIQNVVSIVQVNTVFILYLKGCYFSHVHMCFTEQCHWGVWFDSQLRGQL